MTSRANGFTVLEAIVALGLFALVMISVQRGFATGTRAVRAADQENRAVSVAKSVMASAGTDITFADGTVTEGTQAGVSWQVRTSKYQPPDTEPTQSTPGLYWVEAEVRWRDTALSPQKTLQLKTLKLGKMP